MPRRFVAKPSEGVPGRWINDDGSVISGLYTMTGEYYEPGEALPERVNSTLAHWKAKCWDSSTSSLRIPTGDGVLVIGPDVLSTASDDGHIIFHVTFASHEPPKR